MNKQETTIPEDLDASFNVTVDDYIGCFVSRAKDLISKSEKLHVVRQIACITSCYNIHEIKAAFGISSIVDIFTFNRFLYENVVRPYRHFLTLKVSDYEELTTCGIDDTIILSKILFDKFPNLYTLIKSRYPYIFIVGYKNNTPYVDACLDKLKEAGVVVGIINRP